MSRELSTRAPLNWRNQEHLVRKWSGVRYGQNGNGHNTSEDPLAQPEVQSIKISGNNGRHEKENPLEATTIYSPETTSGGNENQPIKGTVEVAAASD
jgi:hypothetical protein